MSRRIWSMVGVLTLGLVLLSIPSLLAQSATPQNGPVGNTVQRMAGIWTNGKLLWDFRVPVIASGCGTSPSVSSNNGNATFRITMGTGLAGGTSDSTCVLTMPSSPSATNGWNCHVQHLSAPAGFAMVSLQTSTSATSITLTGYRDDGAASAWKASTDIAVSCKAY